MKKDFFENKKIIAGILVIICVALGIFAYVGKGSDALVADAEDKKSEVITKDAGDDEKSRGSNKEDVREESKDVSEEDMDAEESPEENGEDGEDEKEESKESTEKKQPKDTTPPVITGVHDIEVMLGSGIQYKNGVSVSDDTDKAIELNVDTSGVNTGAIGTYPVKYSAKDAAGNETVVEARIVIKPKEVTQDEVNALADQVLSGIISPGMSGQAKCQAIYNYVTKNIRYYPPYKNNKDSILAAYDGLYNKKGDCYVYAKTSKILLTRAGILNRDIEKIPSKVEHYWNLVNIGNGWVHFDTTPNLSEPVVILLWDDAKLTEFSDRHNGSHNYDRTIYTNIS